MNEITELPSLCTKSDVATLLRMCERSIERLVKARQFPPPVRLGKMQFWEREAVDAWLNTRFESQRNWSLKKSKA